MLIKKNGRVRRGLAALPFHFLAFPLCLLPAASQTLTVPAAPARIERIIFRGNRTDEKLLRKHLPFSEGDPLSPSTLKDAQTSLWNMRQFKQVDVSSSAIPGGNAEISINVTDGWYLVPLPFFTGGSGGGRGGIVLIGRNIFRQTESLMASAFSSSAGSSAALALRREKWSLSTAVRRRSITERHYADGAFSAGSGFGPPPDERDPSRYGIVANSYHKTTDETAVAAGIPLTRGSGRRSGLSATFGWEHSELKYSAPSPGLPGDAGRQGRAFVSLKSGHDGTGAAEAIGAIFGFGLADMERRLAPLPAPSFASGAETSYHRGAAWTGSDFSYGYLLAQWDGTLSWGTHRSLSLRLAGGHGKDLPPNRLLATGRETGLSGNYAREFRGASATGASLVYSHPFRITRRGMWQGALFVEAARAWGAAAAGGKTGAGASFWYKFWRFPLPLGFSCTYSLDDRDPQVSAALGGRF
ncbi:MAG: hypothetical protein A2X34_01920 [Elusimicrobia bacterium GWC2_51_8]|nr:MAG: hypothetical protein A2X33_05725 [Elusimicrobia bacterium GWA2_51_34]OGR63814.1 MAG: hypothetical protein A2X34_01920 [Elusimicrobia bacterium GWC2_51_8]OGR85479.1 MAG: hypothetical protein A2021_08085 [Elusimicrobia bacterium GWF2_52_66]HAF94962.1 hypothetical protein [Elusimicrobiota bacterium]HCE99128.1 hypothetical protein [Elusimicrobiota bacterium]